MLIINGWLVISQSFTLKKYPAELSLTAWICLLGILEGGVVTLVMERKLSVWVIGWDSRLLAAVYSVSSLSLSPTILNLIYISVKLL